MPEPPRAVPAAAPVYSLRPPTGLREHPRISNHPRSSACTQRLVRAWFREAAQDLVERAVKRHHACRALGMAGVAPAAVDRLRSTFAEPSLAHPFIEPSLPFYDAIRDDPPYSALLAETRGG